MRLKQYHIRRFPADLRAGQVQRILSVCRYRPGHFRAHALRHEHGTEGSTELQVSETLHPSGVNRLLDGQSMNENMIKRFKWKNHVIHSIQ